VRRANFARQRYSGFKGTEAYRVETAQEAMSEMRKQAVGYIRVSSEEQASGGESLTEQRTMIEQWCEANDVRLGHVYEDAGFSGDDRNRPALNEMMSKLAGIDFVVIAAQDRLARKESIYWTVRDAIGEKRRLVSVTEAHVGTDSADGRLVESIGASTAYGFAKKISENVRRGQRGHVRKGRSPQAKVPFGYRHGGYEIGPDGKRYRKPWVVHDDEADVVRRIHDLYMNQGYGSTRIAHLFNHEGIPAPSGRLWTDMAVRTILDRGIYSGVLIWGMHPNLGHGSSASRERKPKDEWIITPPEDTDLDFHPPILPLGMWFEVREARERRRPAGKRPSIFAPFTSKLRCGGCGGAMGVRWWDRESGERVYQYRCSTRVASGEAGCANPAPIYEDTVMRAVYHDLSQRIAEMENDQASAINQVIASAEERRQQAKEALADEERKRRRHVDDRDGGYLTDEEFHRLTERWRDRVAELESIIETTPDTEAERHKWDMRKKWLAHPDFDIILPDGRGMRLLGKGDPGYRTVDRDHWRQMVDRHIDLIHTKDRQVAQIVWR
jgi:site-specific DNA recombinase